MMRIVVKSALAIACLSFAACGGDGGSTPPRPDAGIAVGAKHQFVMNTMSVPTTPSQAQQYGLNLDGDPQNRPDNLLGQILSTLASQNVDIQSQIDDAVMMGDLIILHEVQTDDFTNWPTAGWQVYLGESTANPDFSGSGNFTVDPQGPNDANLVGTIAGGHFSGGPAKVTLKIALVDGAPPLTLDLIGARVEADVTMTGCTSSKLGGAITQSDIDTKVLPAVADMMNTTVSGDPGCAMTPPMCGDSAQTLLDLFDNGIACTDAGDCPADASMCDIPAGMTEGLCACGAATCNGQLAGDMVVTKEELKADDLISSILSPDVDLLDADGNFNPRVDGVEDSVSLGVGFTCVGATFTP